MDPKTNLGAYKCHFCGQIYTRTKHKRKPNVFCCPDCIPQQVHWIHPTLEASKVELERYFNRKMLLLRELGVPYTWYQDQGGKCAVCGTTDPGGHGAWCLDRRKDLKGSLRGILCSKCSSIISHLRGHSQLDRELLEKLLSHLDT